MGRMKDIYIDLEEDIIETKTVFGVKWYSYDGINWYKSAMNALLANIGATNLHKAENEELMSKAEEEEMRKCLW